MPRRLIALILCLLLPALAMAEERPRAGILWNRSGLPATFPLQVKTFSGKDHVVFLVEPESDKEVMAGYIRGGQFFRLLVPPGKYRLRFASGTEWQGEDKLFGKLTEWTEGKDILDFHLLGIGRRSGYLVTLIEENGTMKIVDAAPLDSCQVARWEIFNREWPEDRESLDLFLQDKTQFRPSLRYVDYSFDSYRRLCD